MASNSSTKTDDVKPIISIPTQADPIPSFPRNLGISPPMSPSPTRLLTESRLPVASDANPCLTRLPILIRTYKCKECPAEFPTHNALGGHASSHAKRRIFQQKVAERIMEARREWKERQLSMVLPHNPPLQSDLFLNVHYMTRLSPLPPPPSSPSSPPVLSVPSMENSYDNDYDEILSDDGESERSVTSRFFF